MHAPVRVAIVGCGVEGVGLKHVRAYQQLPRQFEVGALCDLDLRRASALADTCVTSGQPRPTLTTKINDLWLRDDIEVIDVCTPPYVHAQHIQDAMHAGKHVICEKPLVGSLRELDLILALQRDVNVHVMPISQYRFGNGLEKLHKLIQAGITGPCHIATAEINLRRDPHYYADAPWRGKWKTEYGGTIATHAIHMIDYLVYLLGPVRSVTARTATRVNPVEVDDCAAMLLEMEQGTLVTLSATLGASSPSTWNSFHFAYCSAESNRKLHNTGDPWVFSGKTPEVTAQIEQELARYIPQQEEFVGQFARFFQTLRIGAELPVTLREARHALEVITALYISAQMRTAIDLPIEPGDSAYTGWLPIDERSVMNVPSLLMRKGAISS